jgi:hypothetical protein
LYRMVGRKDPNNFLYRMVGRKDPNNFLYRMVGRKEIYKGAKSVVIRT